MIKSLHAGVVQSSTCDFQSWNESASLSPRTDYEH